MPFPQPQPAPAAPSSLAFVDSVAPSSRRRAARFWGQVDRARAEAELFSVPSVAATAIVGPLDRVESIVDACRRRQWNDDGEVLVLTNRASLVNDGWRQIVRASELLAVIEDDPTSFPVVAIDVGSDPAPWLRPLIEGLRRAGVGLVRYALAGQPSDEDLATWLGEVGRPSVLDLLDRVAPRRALELLERGEPIASIAGWPVRTELLTALRAECDAEWVS